MFSRGLEWPANAQLTDGLAWPQIKLSVYFQAKNSNLFFFCLVFCSVLPPIFCCIITVSPPPPPLFLKDRKEIKHFMSLYKTGLILQFPCLEVMFEISNIPIGMFEISNIDWPQNGPRYRSCHLRGQKSLRPLEKSRFFAQGPFRILEMAPFSDFQGLISQCPSTFTAQVH